MQFQKWANNVSIPHKDIQRANKHMKNIPHCMT